jgi:LPS sulfotransferase NodH
MSNPDFFTQPRREATRGIRRFVLVAHPRSGTHFLREILNQHAKVFEAGEVFSSNPDIKRYFFQKANGFRPFGQAPDDSGFTEEDVARPLTWNDLDWFSNECAKVQNKETIGVTLFNQLMDHSLSDGEVTSLLRRKDVTPIFLVRKNLLKAWVSLKRALTTRAWHLDGSGTLLDCPIDAGPQAPDAMIRLPEAFDVQETQAFIESTRAFLDQAEAALQQDGKPYLKVYYEDLCLSGQARTRLEINRVVSFLGLDPLPSYEVKRSQTASGEFYDAIPNRQELVDATGYDLGAPPSSPQGWLARTRLQAERWKAEGVTIALAPAGRFSRELMSLSNLQETRFVGFFDRNPDQPGADCGHLQVHSYEGLLPIHPDFILVASPGLEDEIVRELLSRGYPASSIVRLSHLPGA